MKRFLLIALVLFTTSAHAAVAATLSVLPPTRSATTGDLITIRVSTNTQGVAINQGEGTLTFPTNLLEVVSVSKTPSIFTLWVDEPTYSNGAGTVSWNGGVPTPGYSGADGTIVTITMRAKQTGSATLALTNAAIRANDGKGTDVLSATSPASLAINAGTPPAPQNPIPVTPLAPTAPGDLTLSSKTHPNQDAWYADANPIIDWTLPKNADALEVLASNTAGDTPTVSYKPSVKEKQVTDLADGTWYFNLRYRVGGVWSTVSSYRLNIDTTPPVVATHSFVYDGAAHSLAVSVSASDTTSGIARYELSIDGGAAKKLSSDVFAGGAYLLPERDAGTHTVMLRAVDRAGNTTDISEQFSVEVSVLDTPVFMVGSFAITLLAVLAFMALLSLVSLAAAIAAWYLLVTRHEKPAARKRGNRQAVHRTFGLIRDDLARHVRALRKARDGKELSKAESDLGEGMNANLNDLERYLNEETDLLE